MPTKTARKKTKKPQRRLTISLDEKVYAGLHSKYGRRLSRFIESVVRPYVINKDMAEAYRQMEEPRKHPDKYDTTPVRRSAKTLVRPVVSRKKLAEEYRQMAADQQREAEAHEWCEALIGDVADETR
ncbi:MAG: hypothetical protein ACKV2Q_12570 [Planctomycetaceae bacterium]